MPLMENETLTSDLILKGHRTLATVMFTDCVGFSARMSVNEEHTLDLIRRDLKLMKGICQQFEGRVLKTTGDGLLLCFSSAVKAVQCAIAIQHTIAERATTLPPNDALIHRIGIHLADMYITETDVMGNGVNIAARLQTEADPGGICISQTVYDVAKHGLNLEAEYIGPRELKNIREVVPAYKILLDTENAQADPYANATRHLEQSPNFPRIRKLMFYVCNKRWEGDDYHLNSVNFRALLQEFLSLSGTPEHLANLLQTAIATLSKQAEYTLIGNEILTVVTKLYAVEGAAAAGVAPGAIAPPTTDSTPDMATAISFAPTPPAPAAQPHHQYSAIAHHIEEHPDWVRLKKLLYYICKRQWEGDVQRLHGIPTDALVQELHVLAPRPEQLPPLVDRFVQTLNKRAEYALVANVLLGKLQSLYTPAPAAAVAAAPANDDMVTMAAYTPTDGAAATPPVPTIYQAIATRLEHAPQCLRFKKLIIYVCRNQWLSDQAQLTALPTADLLVELHTLAPTRDRLHLVLQAAIKTLSKEAEYMALASLLLQQLDELYQPLSGETPPAPASPSPASASGSPPVAHPTPRQDATAHPPAANSQGANSQGANSQGANSQGANSPPPPPVESTPAPTPKPKPIDFFDIRLGILKHTNPLKAKILAFSALHDDFQFRDQDWRQLKNNDLEELLRGLVATCQHYTDLEQLLYRTAKRLQQPDALIQTAETVIKSLRTFYVHGKATPLLKLSGEETQISLDEFDESTQGMTTLRDDDEHTRQLAPVLPIIKPGTNTQHDASNSTQLLSNLDQEPTAGA